jgi:ribosomal RNA-processing protein 12
LGAENDLALEAAQLRLIMEAILASSPSKFETSTVSSWVTVVAHALVAFSRLDLEASSKLAPSVWKAVWPFLESADSQTRKATVNALDLISYCFSPALIQDAVTNQKSAISQLIDQTEKGLTSLALAQSMPEVLAAIAHLITNLDIRNHEVAEPLLLPLIEHIGEFRTQKGFEHKEAVDIVLSAAIRAFGPHVLLEVLPLNLEPSDRSVQP